MSLSSSKDRATCGKATPVTGPKETENREGSGIFFSRSDGFGEGGVTVEGCYEK